MSSRLPVVTPLPRYVLLVLGLLVAQTVLAPAVAAAPDEHNPRECVEAKPAAPSGVPVTVERGPVENSVTLSVDPEDAQSAFHSGWGINLPPGTELYSKAGFGTPAGYERLYRPLSNKENYTLTYTYEENETGESSGNSMEKYEGEDEWAIAPLPRSYNGEGVTYHTSSEAVVGQWLVYFGDYTMTTVANDCHRIRLVVPDSADLDRNRTAILDSLQYTDRHLGGQRYDEVTIFVTPERFEAYGGVARRSDAVVSPSRGLPEDDARNHIWIHEYIHTRQTYNPTGDFDWWTEASTNYLSIRMGLRSGYLTPERYNEVLSDYGENETGDAVLANESTWHNYSTYKRGVLALARLDAKIRADTNGSVTVVAVFNATERHQPATHANFTALLENQTGNKYDEWSANYIRGTTTGELKMQADTEPNYVYGIALTLFLLLVGVYFERKDNETEGGDNQ